MVIINIDPKAVQSYLSLSNVNLTKDQAEDLTDQLTQEVSREVRAKLKATLDKVIAEASQQ